MVKRTKYSGVKCILTKYKEVEAYLEKIDAYLANHNKYEYVVLIHDCRRALDVLNSIGLLEKIEVEYKT